MKDKRILEAYTFKNLENVQNIRLDDYQKGLYVVVLLYYVVRAQRDKV